MKIYRYLANMLFEPFLADFWTSSKYILETVGQEEVQKSAHKILQKSKFVNTEIAS